MKTIQLSGIVGLDIKPQQLKAFLDESAGDDIVVDMQTPGGYLYEAFQIHNMIKEYPGKKTAQLNGQVMSAGTYIATAFDRVVVRENTVFMIHNAMNAVFGDYRAHQKEAEELRSLNGILSNAYSIRSKQSRTDIQKKMDAETYWHGKEIVEAGFADEMMNNGEASNKDGDLAAARLAFTGIDLPNRSEDITRACQYAAMHRSTLDAVREKTRGMIENGAIDVSAWDDRSGDITYLDADKRFPYGKNGKVYQSALRFTASRAGRDNPDVSALAGELIKLIQTRTAKNIQSGGFTLETRDEAIQLLKNAITNEHLTHVEIATALGFGDKIATTEQRAALALVGKLKEMGIEDPVAWIDRMKADEKANEVKVRNAALDTAFGAIEENGKPNVLRAYAADKLGAVATKEIEAKIEEFKKDPIALELAGKRADVFNSINVIELNTNQPARSATTRRVDVV